MSEPLAPIDVAADTARRCWVESYRGGILLTVDMYATPRFDPRALADHIGEPVDVTGPDGAHRRMLIRKVDPSDDGGAMLVLEEPYGPVPETPYPDPIPREDQDSAHACCAPDRGAEVPADQVRTARAAPGGRDDR